jgi:hypothetical protein
LVAAGLTLLGLIVFGAIAWFAIGAITIGGFTWEITSAGINRAGATQIVLTMVAGAGAAVALVVTYRRQRRLEDGHFLERLGSSAAQLGDDKPAVQFAGIYALAALADESAIVKRQQVVDVLCAYIRLPYDPSITGNAGTETRAEKTTHPDIGGVQQEITVTTTHKPGEREVRATIFRVIRDHLTVEAVTPWSELTLDFSGATIDQCEFGGAIFSGGQVSFQGATFPSGWTSFVGATFSGGDVSFRQATFSGGRVSFADARFSSGPVGFVGANFSGGDVSFEHGRFAGGVVTFWRADFSGGRVSFSDAGFSGSSVTFSDAQFSGGDVDFQGAKFTEGGVDFQGARFSKGQVVFRGAKFSGGGVSFVGEEVPHPSGVIQLGPPRYLGGKVDFTQPMDWTEPPEMTWHDGEEPPKGVLPRLWPPAVDVGWRPEWAKREAEEQLDSSTSPAD